MLDDIIELHRAGRLPEAEAGYRVWLAANPDDPEALHLLGILRGQRGDNREALAWVQRAVERDGEHAPFQFTLAELHLYAGELDAAEAAYQRARQLNPNLTHAHAGLGQVAFLRGRLEDAESHFRIALRADENDAQALAGLGNIAFARNELEKASRYLTEAAKFAAKDALIQGSLANVMLAMKMPEFAARTASNALALKPDYAVAWNVLGNALLLKGDAQGATAAFEALLAQGEQLAAAHLGLGDIARLQQRHEEAIARYEQALAFDADLHPAAIRRADSLARSGRVEEAVSGLVERASRYPEAGYLKVAIATLLSQQKKHAEALAWWRDAAALLPNDANAQAGFALSLDLAGEHEAALQQAQRVPVDGPRQSGLALLRARAALRGGDPAEALRALESLDESQWQESPIAAHRRWKLAGLAHDALAQWTEAARAFERTLRNVPPRLPELPELDEVLIERIRERAAEEPLRDSSFAPPVLLVGMPGTGVWPVLHLLAAQPRLLVRGERASVAVNDFLSAPFAARLLQPLGDADLRWLQRGYARAQQRGATLREGMQWIDWLPHLDARLLPALKRALPGVRLVRVAADPHDALLNWLAFGGDGRWIQGDPVAVARWMKRQIAHLQLAEELLPTHVVDDIGLLNVSGGDFASSFATFLSLDGLATETHATGKNRAGLPMAFAPGHWRHYREALAEVFAALA